MSIERRFYWAAYVHPEPKLRSIVMEVFKPLIHEFKETVADICFKFGLPCEWISPNLMFTDQNLFGGQHPRA